MKLNKMVLIKRHKGYKIIYDKSEFKAVKGKKELWSHHTETGLIEIIERMIKQAKESIEQKKKQIMLERNIKKTTIELDLKEFKRFLDKIKMYDGGEVKIKYKDNKLTCVTMDPANVLMLQRTMPCKAIYKKLEAEFIINMDNINLTGIELNKGKISLTIDADGRKYLIIENGFGKFTIPVLEDKHIDYREHKIPELKFTASLNIAGLASKFYEVITCAGKVSESVDFEKQGNKFYIKADGDSKTLRYEYVSYCKTEGIAKARYSVSYLGNNPKKRYFDADSMLTLSFSTDYPLKVEDNLGNWIIVAPRINND